MNTSQYQNRQNIFTKASRANRLCATAIFLSISAFLTFLTLAAFNKIDIDPLLPPCGFQQNYNLPCPTCGMTTASLKFVKGQILQSFYTQPAGALLCIILTASALLAFITAAFGVYFTFIANLAEIIKTRYILLIGAIVILAAWAVTLARAYYKNL